MSLTERHTLIPRIAWLLAGLMLAGCETVTSLTPVGAEPAKLSAAEWEGPWYDPQHVLQLSVADAAQGRVTLTWREEGQPRQMNLRLRTSGDWLIFNVLQAEVDEENTAMPGSDQRWYWGRVINKGDRLLLWSPRADAFVNAVERGQLPGTVLEGSVVLDSLTATQLQWLTADDQRSLMDSDDPVVLFRTLPQEFEKVPVTEPES
jgi:hypothetical protein